MSDGAVPDLDEAVLRELALRPFQVLETLGLPSRYERSFKLRPGALLAQRYLLSVRTADASLEQLTEAARALGMPEALHAQFVSALGGARSVLFGFEGSAHDAVLKVYIEYHARLAASARASGRAVRPSGAGPAPAVMGSAGLIELFRGFKWRADRPDPGVQTLYRCRPGLAIDAIRRHIGQRLDQPSLAVVRDTAWSILDRSLAARPQFVPLWLEVGELGQPVRAFDLNLYEAGLRVESITAELLRLASAFGIEHDLITRLLDAAGHGLLGHLSAGVARDGNGFLTIYFEPR